MNKEQLVSALARRNHTTIPAARGFLDSFTALVTQSLASGEKVRLSGFGVFEPRLSAPRTGRNPKTNTPVPIPSRRCVVFHPGSALRSAVGGDA